MKTVYNLANKRKKRSMTSIMPFSMNILNLYGIFCWVMKSEENEIIKWFYILYLSSNKFIFHLIQWVDQLKCIEDQSGLSGTFVDQLQ